ncbi:TauD/TfdA family dioxygenase, partial [Streptomyces sp. NPDC088178]
MTHTQAWTPLEIETESIGGCEELVERITGMGEEFDKLLVAEKGLVFRGFGVTPADLDQVLDTLLPNRLAYVHGNSPRTKVGSNVYTSTEYPQEFTISMHNEMSYAHAWPSRLAFYCQVQPGSGGATPVVDAAVWL